MTLEFEVTEDDYVDFNVYYLNRNKKNNIRTLLVCIIIALALLIRTISTFQESGSVEYINVFIAGVFLWACLYIKSRSFVRRRSQKVLQGGKNAGLLGVRTIILKEEFLVMKSEYFYGEYKWNSFENLSESKELLLLFQTVNQAIIIPKRIFLLPQEEYDVKAFIERKLTAISATK